MAWILGILLAFAPLGLLAAPATLTPEAAQEIRALVETCLPETSHRLVIPLSELRLVPDQGDYQLVYYYGEDEIIKIPHEGQYDHEIRTAKKLSELNHQQFVDEVIIRKANGRTLRGYRVKQVFGDTVAEALSLLKGKPMEDLLKRFHEFKKAFSLQTGLEDIRLDNVIIEDETGRFVVIDAY